MIVMAIKPITHDNGSDFPLDDRLRDRELCIRRLLLLLLPNSAIVNRVCRAHPAALVRAMLFRAECRNDSWRNHR